jgi:conjugal transfer/entry exclusion protein
VTELGGHPASSVAQPKPSEPSPAGDGGANLFTPPPAVASPTEPASTTPTATPAEEPSPGSSGRRTAKRRSAGQPRTQVAANDDLPSIGGLIFALHEKPSKRPMHVAAIASGAWAFVSLLLGWAMLAPELQRAPTVLEMLTRPTAITLAATVILPIAMFWFIALLVWRAHELRLMSSAMTEVAIRLAEPDRMAEQQIASVGQAVRRQVNHMNEAVSRALGRAGELEALVHNEVASLERSYTQNENRIRGLLEDLAGERNALLNTSERVSYSLKELGGDIPALVDKLSEQQVKLARFIEQAGQNLVSLEQSLSNNATHFAQAVGTRTQELHGVLTDGTAEIRGLLESRTSEIASALQTGKSELETSLVSHSEEMQATFDGFAGGLDTALGQRTSQLKGMLDETAQSIEGTLTTRTEGLQTVLEEYTRALDATMEARQHGLDQQLLQRTKALDDAFSERIKLFDDSILRSTIAIDSTVADKARALSTALETHAHEIAQVLGEQAGQLDEQIMHGVHAVRRASENVTRQSVQAIEGLAGQADLLRNLSDNLVSQITSVTNRFDQQGQTIMRAAGALETANQRIDQNLQHRQAELGRTLEHIATKAEDIDKVMRGYPASLEGTLNTFETRALSAGEQLARGVEEQSRRAMTEMERLRTATGGETDRAVADLREKFQSISREVSQEIGSMQNRFSSGYDDIRQRAKRTLSELDQEQSRLKAELDRLPEATRASAETMRQSLQEQLKALEQLSTLSRREAQRADVTPPPGHHASPMPGAGRAISSVTQTLANELAARGHRPPAALPPTADAGREGWKLGDLLARASKEDGAPGELNLAGYARALDQTTASAIWSRFRAGQRGVMVRSIYSVEGRNLFDDVQQRLSSDTGFRQLVERYQHDFQRILREAEQRDPSGRLAQSHVISDPGRAFLFLAHASGQLV